VHADDGGEETPGHDEAVADFPDLPADGNDELPSKEVHRGRERASQPERLPEPVEPIEEPAPALEAQAPAHEEPPAVKEAPAPRRRTESSEPRLERIVVSTADGSQPASEEAPARKGWWQRKLGG